MILYNPDEFEMFEETKTMQHAKDQEPALSEEQGQALVQLARLTLENRLFQTSRRTDEALQQILDQPRLQQKQGTFVTLHIQGSLRGCIGSLTAETSIVKGVQANAINAAFNDPRFPGLSADELPKTQIEVSVLSTPQALDYTSAQDLLNRLRPHIDGVILQKGAARSTFLPQVWEQLPDSEQFLGQLCLKAGLPADAWKSEHPDIRTYQVQYFE